MTISAHIAGLPVEESVATFGAALLATGSCCVVALRSRLRRPRRERRTRPRGS
jgi:hypothetical protein